MPAARPVPRTLRMLVTVVVAAIGLAIGPVAIATASYAQEATAVTSVSAVDAPGDSPATADTGLVSPGTVTTGGIVLFGLTVAGILTGVVLVERRSVRA